MCYFRVKVNYNWSARCFKDIWKSQNYLIFKAKNSVQRTQITIQSYKLKLFKAVKTLGGRQVIWVLFTVINRFSRLKPPECICLLEEPYDPQKALKSNGLRARAALCASDALWKVPRYRARSVYKYADHICPVCVAVGFYGVIREKRQARNTRCQESNTSAWLPWRIQVSQFFKHSVFPFGLSQIDFYSSWTDIAIVLIQTSCIMICLFATKIDGTIPTFQVCLSHIEFNSQMSALPWLAQECVGMQRMRKLQN